jgi:ActR/RegA family two-component response regulator
MAENINTASGELIRALNEMSATPYEISRLYARAAYERFGGNMSKTARALGMHRRSLQRMLQSSRPERIEQ